MREERAEQGAEGEEDGRLKKYGRQLEYGRDPRPGQGSEGGHLRVSQIVVETDAADGSVGLEVGSLVPEEETSGHGGGGDAGGRKAAATTTSSHLIGRWKCALHGKWSPGRRAGGLAWVGGAAAGRVGPDGGAGGAEAEQEGRGGARGQGRGKRWTAPAQSQAPSSRTR